MKLKLEGFVGKSKNEIIEQMLKYITKEPDLKERGGEDEDDMKPVRTDLKIIVVKNNGLDITLINDIFQQIYFSSNDDKIKEFIDDTVIKIKELTKGVYGIKIRRKIKGLSHVFIILEENDYWQIFTLEKSKYIKPTIIRMIKTLPVLEIVKLAPVHLESFAKRPDYSEDIKGFTARYKPYKSKRNITVQVFGGDLEDLESLRSQFYLEPYSIEFEKMNSPAVEGKVVSSGYYSIRGVNVGGSGLATRIINEIKTYYEDTNTRLFERVNLFDNHASIIKKKAGYTTRSRFALVIKIKKERFDMGRKDSITLEDLINNLRLFFKNHPATFLIESRNDFMHFILDKRTRSRIQVSIEPNFKTIVLYPYKYCSVKTLRDVTINIANKIESSISEIAAYSFSS